MRDWELARYLIDAKKNIDSLIYINKNLKEICNLDIKSKISSIQAEFYLKICFILDDVYNNGKKKEICNCNKIIDSIYKERDKDKAHKDKNYIKPNYNSISEMIDVMKKQIFEVKNVCTKNLPEVLTLDLVPHDRDLFRFVNGLNPNKENEIKKKKYDSIEVKNQRNKKLFNDTEEIRIINQNEKDSYAVMIKDGINIYEGIQERQDAIIKLNVLFDGNLWVEFNQKNQKKINELIKNGLIDEYGMPIEIEKLNEEKLKIFNKIMNNEDEINE